MVISNYRWVWVLVFCWCCASAGGATGQQDSLPVILARDRTVLLNRAALDAKTIADYQAALQADGRWPDVDYGNQDRAGWKTMAHLSRIQAMAAAYALEGQGLHGNKALLDQIDLALDHWLAKRYQNPNWWYNKIWVPRAMADISVLLNDELTGERRKAAMAIMSEAKIGMTGANLMDLAQIDMIRSCLTGDTTSVAKAANAISREIVVGHAEGIQDDWSFHQHGACAQTLSYGRVYLQVLSQVGYLLRGTPYEIPPPQRAIVSQFFLNGIQWMTRGSYTAPSTMDRQVNRPGALRASGDFREMLKQWSEADPAHAAELKQFLARQEGTATPLVGFKHFPRSDLTVYHRPGFTFFLKTRSIRVKGTENTNDENLKGRPFLHTGDHYLVRDGSEYTDLPPVWDWQRLPGLTMFDGIGPLVAQSFVGGVGNETSGLTAMAYQRALSVRKLWAYHGDLILCLEGGWVGAEQKNNLRTTMEQCRLVTPVQVNVGGTLQTFADGTQQIQNVRWVLHHGVGYVPLTPAEISLRTGEAEGCWSNINIAGARTLVKERVFCLDLLHGAAPVSGGFLLAPGSTPETLELLTAKPTYRVVQNDGNIQCVRFNDGTFMAAFYAPGTVAQNGTFSLAVDKPCLVLGSEAELWLCNPMNSQQGMQVNVMWQGQPHSLRLPAGGKPLCLGLRGN